MKHIFSLLILLSLFLLFSSKASAVENPLSVPNNKIGIHLLFPSELAEAAKLVNSNGGEWGYVTLPIQAGDKDRIKWQHFMDEAAHLRIIPIIRLATQSDYFNTTVWSKPEDQDILDFANFLNSLNWPVKNKYIVIYNETNRSDEWGGSTNPGEYAQILSYAVTVFKSKNPDFFIIGGGFDNAAPQQGIQYNDQYFYIKQMNDAIPGIFNQIDGYASHSYPNPGFSQHPQVQTRQSIASFRYERELINSLSNKKLPIFITETGWSSKKISDSQRAEYYKQAFQTVWNDPDIVAVTPFLLRAHAEPFTQFSFLNEDGSKTLQYQSLESLPKTKGMPVLPIKILGVHDEPQESEIKFFKKKIWQKNETLSLSQAAQKTFFWIMRL